MADDKMTPEMLAAWRSMEPARREVIELCERLGFGFVMDEASREWRRRDPVGAISLGECYGTLAKQERLD